jgi:hypothetical protein
MMLAESGRLRCWLGWLVATLLRRVLSLGVVAAGLPRGSGGFFQFSLSEAWHVAELGYPFFLETTSSYRFQMCLFMYRIASSCPKIRLSYGAFRKAEFQTLTYAHRTHTLRTLS